MLVGNAAPHPPPGSATVPLGRSPYIFCGCQWMAKVTNGEEILPKIPAGLVGLNDAGITQA